jgi:hypothetical protein
MDDTQLPEVMSDEEVLAFTQRHRLAMVRQITKAGTVPTSDPKEAKLFLDVLNEVDKTVFTRKKLAVDEGVGSAAQQAIAMAAELFKDKRGSNFSNSQNFTPRDGNLLGPPDIDDTLLPPVTLVPGEMDAMGNNESYKDFMERAKATAANKAKAT